MLTLTDADKRTTTPGTYVAIDNAGKTYLLAICNVNKKQTKVFLVDGAGKLPALQTEIAQVTVTGGPTTRCETILLQSPGFAGV